ncbi:hypothetical protein AOLI_G00292150 [Acnodon oligacanthus]
MCQEELDFWQPKNTIPHSYRKPDGLYLLIIGLVTNQNEHYQRYGTSSCVVQQLCKRGPRLHSLSSSSLSHDVMRVRSALSVCVQCKPESGSPSCLSECRCGGLVVAAGVTAGS